MRTDSRLRTTYLILFVLVTLLSSAGIYLLKYPSQPRLAKNLVKNTKAIAGYDRPAANTPNLEVRPQKAVPQPILEPEENPMVSAMLPAQSESPKVVETKPGLITAEKKVSRKLASTPTPPINEVVEDGNLTQVKEPESPVVAAEPTIAAEPPIKQIVKLEVVVPTRKQQGPNQLPPKVGAKFLLGAGLNYFRYQENLSDVNTNYNGTRGPSFLVGANFSVTERTQVMALYKSTPIYFDNASVGFSRLQSSWNTLELQAISKLNSLSNSRREFNFLYGLQFHEMPLALFKNISNQPMLRNLSLANASLGASNVSYLNPWTRTSIFGRVQYPLSTESISGSNISVKPQLLFDGSVGIEKNVSSLIWLGLHWYGQYQKINFKYSEPAVSSEGQQSAVFSTLELRLNLDY